MFDYDWKRGENLAVLNAHLQQQSYIQLSTGITGEGWYRDDFNQHTILVLRNRLDGGLYMMYFWSNCDPRPIFRQLLGIPQCP